jgi:hypothetical protein
LIDHGTADLEAWARWITGGPRLILDAIGRYSLKNKLSATRVQRRARHIWRFVGATDKTGAIFGTLSMLTSAPWLQFDPLSLMNGNKGASASNLGMWTSSVYWATTASDESGLSATLCDSAPPVTKV